MGVRSEYRRQFKPKFQCYVKVYEGNVDYRMQRRQVEAGHSQDAFVWQDTDYETDSENSCGGGEAKPSNRTPRAASVPLHLYKHVKFNEAYQRRQDSQRGIVIQQGLCQQQKQKLPQDAVNNNDADDLVYIDIGKSSPREVKVSVLSPRVTKSKGSPKVSPRLDTESDEEEQEDEGHRNRQVQTPDWSRVKKRRDKKAKKSALRQQKEKASQTNGDDAAVEPDDDDAALDAAAAAQPARPVKPGQRVPRHKKSLPKPRPMSAPLGRPAKKSPRSPERTTEDKPPFVPYGFKDKEKETGTKKTYNIRASVDVYPSALRAARRKQLDIAEREKAAKEAPYRERRQKALFNDFDKRMQRETSQWDTEYRRHFVGYEKGLYERQVCSRSPAAKELRPQVKHHDCLRASC